MFTYLDAFSWCHYELALKDSPKDCLKRESDGWRELIKMFRENRSPIPGKFPVIILSHFLFWSIFALILVRSLAHFLKDGQIIIFKSLHKFLFGDSVTWKISPNVYKKLPKNDFTRNMIDFDTFTKIA